MDDFLLMIIFIATTLIVISLMRRTMRKASSSTATTASSSSTAKPQKVSKNQIAEDIKATKTSQVADAVSILNDLDSTSSNYRHYCELVGRSMASSGVIAPYSKRPVAYYDIKCYRIDATYGGGQTETLVAHEHSFDPFFFTDSSTDTPVYIDLESFGDNVILVNSTNHIEGPNSDFAKAFEKNASSAVSGSANASYAVARSHVHAGASVLRGAAAWLRSALAALFTPRWRPAFALALASGGSLRNDNTDEMSFDHIMFDRDDHDGRGVTSGRGGGRTPQGKGRPQVTIHMGYGSQMPGHLGDFMGPSHQPYVMGGGYSMHRPTMPSSTEVLLGMSLGALLNSMTTTQQTVQTASTVNTFRGYRLVENIVPLGSPIYCIGEIYHHGTDVYMSRSLAKDYPTSFFATKPESEVLSAIGGA